MSRTEMVQIITLLAGNYEAIANKSQNQREIMLNTWYECLGDLDYRVVLQAVKMSIISNPYPPTIHDIRKNAIEIIKPNEERSAIEAWEEAHRMICNGIYMTQEEFDQASPEVKKFFGNIRQVQELAKTDSDTVNTVTKGQFLKQYEIITEREKARKMLPEKWLNITTQLAEKMSVKQIGE